MGLKLLKAYEHFRLGTGRANELKQTWWKRLEEAVVKAEQHIIQMEPRASRSFESAAAGILMTKCS
ncbi:unnamed protein product [Linum tenue]|uniref:Uncharacterized protein n=1 Tax=Linum tenue TaxID=586396 RepID=A0AAV0H4D6_9ROSI|nr:unnamed protein product [Linum tenue]